MYGDVDNHVHCRMSSATSMVQQYGLLGSGIMSASMLRTRWRGRVTLSDCRADADGCGRYGGELSDAIELCIPSYEAVTTCWSTCVLASCILNLAGTLLLLCRM